MTTAEMTKALRPSRSGIVKHISLALTVALGIVPPAVLGGPLQVGMGVVEITPPVGYRMSGYFHERLGKGVKDPLLAKAIVFAQDDTFAALVFCDIIGLDPKVAYESRRLIAQRLEIPAANVSVAATHTHTGPLYWGALRDHFHEAAMARNGSDPHEEFDYPAFLTRQIVAAVHEATQNREAVRIFAGYGHEDRIAFNRRFLMKDGRVRTWIGVNHPDVVRPASPIDPEIGLIRFDSLTGSKPLCAITSYALHLDTLGGEQFSADFPFYLQQQFSQRYGTRFVSLFGIGPCGDINHVNTAAKERNNTETIGLQIAESVFEALPGLDPTIRPSLAVKNRIVRVPKQQFTAEQVAQAKQDMEHVGDRNVPFPKRVEAYKITALKCYEDETIPLEVHAYRLGPDVAIVTLPGEVFVELGLRIKLKSPFKTTLVIELANDAPGYLPTKKAFVEGGYETINSRIAPGGGEKMVDNAIDLLKELHTSD